MEIDNIGDPINWYTKWDNDWSRIIFDFVPTSDTINIILSDEITAQGTTLYWDFVELEEAYAVPEASTLGLLALAGLSILRRRRK
jgi:hypothetical protein